RFATTHLRIPDAWDLRWWVDRGRFVVRGDGYGIGWIECGLRPEPVLGSSDAEVGHLAFDDAGV
ncbi:hypothetical protein J7I97_20180, partial [Streptomyces sp. ISL-87]|uniref:hypothetical protein n=1 Tax=Streptomyces sp. ISL-87 TaxID=2819188 RepID=UPI001BEA7C4F